MTSRPRDQTHHPAPTQRYGAPRPAPKQTSGRDLSSHVSTTRLNSEILLDILM
jgi:hypothetical protein